MSVYGYCPKCGSQGIDRERRIDGNDKCQNGHTYPSKTSVSSSSDSEYWKTQQKQHDEALSMMWNMITAPIFFD